MAALMFGIDLTETDLQLSLWNEEHTCAEIYRFPGEGGEVLSAVVTVTEAGALLSGKEALEYSLREQRSGLFSLYGRGVPAEVELYGVRMETEELFARYLEQVFAPIRKRFGGAAVARIGLTGERLDEEAKERLVRVFARMGYPREKLYFSTHADAFLWYEMCEEVAPRQGGAMALDYDSEGLLVYQLHPQNEEKGTPYYLEKTDFSEMMPGGLVRIRDEEERAACFARMTELVLNRREAARLYVTGMHTEGQAQTRILENFSKKDRRIFCGRSLYSLGACYHAVRERFAKRVIGDNQIFHNVSLEAYADARQTLFPMAVAGSPVARAGRTIQVILDDTKGLRFQVEDLRTTERIFCTLVPDHLRERENRTVRLEVAVRFLDCDTLVIKVRDVGFGALYPATYRVWEQLISLNVKYGA